MMSRRLRLTGEPLNVDSGLERLSTAFADDERVVAIILFGSYGTADQTPLSDVDIALVVTPEAARDDSPLLDLTSDVHAFLGEDDASVVILNRQRLPFQYKVLATGRPLFVRDETLLADFKEYVFKRHSDFAIDYAQICRDYDTFLAEEYGS